MPAPGARGGANPAGLSLLLARRSRVQELEDWLVCPLTVTPSKFQDKSERDVQGGKCLQGSSLVPSWKSEGLCMGCFEVGPRFAGGSSEDEKL